MDDASRSQRTSQDMDLASGGPKIDRRMVIKAGAASVAGLALGTTYVKPGVISVGVQEVYAFSYEVSTPPTTSEIPTAAAPAVPAPAAEGKPAALPSAGEGAVAFALPGALGLLGLSATGLGYGVSRIHAASLAAADALKESSALDECGLGISSD